MTTYTNPALVTDARRTKYLPRKGQTISGYGGANPYALHNQVCGPLVSREGNGLR